MNSYLPTITKNSLVPKNIFLWIASAWTLAMAVVCLVTFEELPGMNLQNSDKFGHIMMHFLFSLFWFFHFRTANRELRSAMIAGMVLGLSTFYGIMIELAQKFFTSTRNADLGDVLANFAGAFSALMLLLAYSYYSRKQKYN